jgi:hypothetical protein
MVEERETDIPVTESSGNVFADIGLPEAEEDVDITVRAKPRDRAHGRIRVLGEAHA